MQDDTTLDGSFTLERPARRPPPLAVLQTRPKEIPYDHVAVFVLQGTFGRRSEDVINVSVDGAFVATSIGYSFFPAQRPPSGVDLQNLETFISALPADIGDRIDELIGEPGAVLRALAARLLGIDFTYSIIDSATGRELQNRAIHNIAGLGSADGKRPFRPMAKPMLFMPRSTIRVVIEEVSAGPLYAGAQLFIVLHGYKILGYEG